MLLGEVTGEGRCRWSRQFQGKREGDPTPDLKGPVLTGAEKFCGAGVEESSLGRDRWPAPME